MLAAIRTIVTPVDWNLIVGSLSLIVSTALAVVLFRLGRRLDFRSRMDLRAKLKAEAFNLIVTAPSRTEFREIIFLNAQRFEKEWDGGNNFSHLGWLQERGELSDLRHNGIEVVETVVPTWIDDNGNRTLRETPTPAPDAYRLGFVPFDRVQHIEPEGDEYRYAPNIYVQFGRWSRSPFAHFAYAETGTFPLRAGGRRYLSKIDELGMTKLGVRDFWRAWGTATLLGELKRMPSRPFPSRRRPRSSK